MKRRARVVVYLTRGAWGLLGLLVAAGATYALLRAHLPTIRNLSDYQPPEATFVYSDDGSLVGTLATERRRVVPIQEIPQHVIRAFLAAEDASFYEHEGLDYLGILRAAIKNLRPGAHLQGASTITQQTVKTLVVGAERSYVRKLREAILARELERLLTKDEILHLYLNQVYFGSGAYGVGEAARTYFSKRVSELTLGEAALLASIPKNPSRYTPRSDPEAAKQRQRYVLEQMLLHGWADAAAVQQSMQAPVPPPPPPPPYLGQAPYYVEQVRRRLVETYGEVAVYQGGLTVYTGMNARQQVAAQRHLRSGLEQLARRQGYPGAPWRVEVDRFASVREALHDAYESLRQERLAADGRTDAAWLWDLSQLGGRALSHPKEAAERLRLVELAAGTRVRGIVVDVDAVSQEAQVDLGCCTGRLSLARMRWARAFAPDANTPQPRYPGDVVQRGDLVAVDVLEQGGSESGSLAVGARDARVLEVALVPEVRAQGAVVALDPRTRLVSALVGGYELDGVGFNRATQARRQPGSAFKPILYAAALAQRTITPASICADAPIVIRDPWTGHAWKPENFEDGRYDGNITYRTALMRSKNVCSVKLIDRMGPGGPKAVIDMAHALGIGTELPENLTLALGTGEVTPLELANAYATIAAGGLEAEPILIRKVVDRNAAVLEDNRAALEQRLEPNVAYVLTSMMQSVIESGTATHAQVLARPLAGKTGTTNESRSVWFAGFSAELVGTVFVGFDDNAPLGDATGASTALPIWTAFMADALQPVAPRPFPIPEGVTFVDVDPDTGVPSDAPTALHEAFVAGTEPSQETHPLRSIYIEDEPL